MANLFQLTKDSRGRWRRQNLGQREGMEGKVAPATFFLGTDYEEACKRVMLLEKMWEAVQKEWLEHGLPAWDVHTYPIALAVACGEKDISVEAKFEYDLSMQAGYLADLREQFPFLNLLFSDALAQENADRVAESLEKDARKLLESRSLNGIVCGTLHQALDAYNAFITKKYAGKSTSAHSKGL